MAAASFIRRVQNLLVRVRNCTSMAELDQLQREADDRLDQAVESYGNGEMTGEQFSTYSFLART